MGFCTPEVYKEFFRSVAKFAPAEMLVEMY